MRLTLIPFLSLTAVLLASPLAGAQSPLLPTETLFPANGADNDAYGASIAVGPEWMAVGAHKDYEQGRYQAGAIFLYRRQGDDWVLIERLTSPVPTGPGFFGTRVALDGNTLIVSAPGYSGHPSGGHVFVYRFEEAWKHVQTLHSPLPSVSRFGSGLALEGTTLVVGTGSAAPSDAYVYALSADTWTLRDSLQASTVADSYGSKLDISGPRIVVGSISHDAVDVFDFIDDAWERTATLTGDRRGSLDLLDDRILIGSWRNAYGYVAAYVYEWDGADWTRSELSLPSPNDYKNGLAVFAGDTAYVYIDRQYRSPYARLAGYVREDSAWVLRDTLQIAPSADDDLHDERAIAAHGQTVALGWGSVRINRSYRGSSITVVRAGDTPQRQVVTAGSRPTDRRFGQAIAWDGNRLAVMAETATSVYVLGPDGPQLEGVMAGGEALSLDGTRLAVGNTRWGQVYVYELANGVWSLEVTLRGSDSFGASVSLEGSRLLVGETDAKAARVYEFDGTQWTQTASLSAPEPYTGSHFGASVALDGGRALIGAPGERQPDGSFGAAYVYELGTTWAFEARLTATEPERRGVFGRTVALDGGRALVGAPLLSRRTDDRGAVYVFEGTSWRPTAVLAGPGTGDSFGASLSLDGNRAAIGAYLTGGATISTAGTVFTYAFDGHHWAQTHQLAQGETSPGADFGWAVAIQGKRVAASTPLSNWVGQRAGAVYLYENAFPVDGSVAPQTLASTLSVASPNPTRGSSRLTLTLASPERVTATVFDVRGRAVAPLVAGERLSGTVTLNVEGSQLAPGLYVVRVMGESFTEVQPLTVVR